MKNYKPSAAKKQAGMTLIELTVVLLILIGLAGLMIPYVQGFVSKTHDATGADNIHELDNAVQRFIIDQRGLPNGLETLVEGFTASGAGGGATYAKLMNTSYLTPTALTAKHIGSLNQGRLTDVYYNDAATTNATFESIDTAVGTAGLVTLAAGDELQLLGPTVAMMGVGALATVEEHLADAFGGQPSHYDTNCYDYFVLGIGADNEMLGSTIQTAPVHFSANGNMGPTTHYNRFVGVIKVTAHTVDEGAGFEDCPVTPAAGPASYVGSAMIMGYPRLVGAASNHKWVWDNLAS